MDGDNELTGMYLQRLCGTTASYIRQQLNNGKTKKYECISLIPNKQLFCIVGGVMG